MSDWIALITDVVTSAASKADLPMRVGAFDGSGWAWIWRVPLKEQPHRVGEARVRVQPDSLNEGVEIEVSAAAWLDHQREIAASRTISSRFVSYGDLERQGTDFTTGLPETIRRAWQTAAHLAENLPEIERSRAEAARAIENFRTRQPKP